MHEVTRPLLIGFFGRPKLESTISQLINIDMADQAASRQQRAVKPECEQIIGCSVGALI